MQGWGGSLIRCYAGLRGELDSLLCRAEGGAWFVAVQGWGGSLIHFCAGLRVEPDSLLCRREPGNEANYYYKAKVEQTHILTWILIQWHNLVWYTCSQCEAFLQPQVLLEPQHHRSTGLYGLWPPTKFTFQFWKRHTHSHLFTSNILHRWVFCVRPPSLFHSHTRPGNQLLLLPLHLGSIDGHHEGVSSFSLLFRFHWAGRRAPSSLGTTGGGNSGRAGILWQGFGSQSGDVSWCVGCGVLLWFLFLLLCIVLLQLSRL